MTEGLIISCRPDQTQSISILSYDTSDPFLCVFLVVVVVVFFFSGGEERLCFTRIFKEPMITKLCEACFEPEDSGIKRFWWWILWRLRNQDAFSSTFSLTE